MNIFVLNAGGYYSIGTAVVAASDVEAAAELANAENDNAELTYHPFGGNSPDPIGTTDGEPRVINIHSWGMPELPSKGSGQKVTF